MAIIECSHCKELFNEDEQFCPYCGEEASVRLAPVRSRQTKPQRGRNLILGLPLGKWVAALIFLVAALLIVLCVYICLSLSGRVKGSDSINSNINANSQLIDSLTNTTQDSATDILEEKTFGTISESKIKGYNVLNCTSLNFSALIPDGFKVVEEDGSIFICQGLDDDGDYAIPYLVVSKITDFNDEVEFLQDRHTTFAKAYADQEFAYVENLVKYTQGDKTVYEFQFKYTAQTYEFLDTRRAIKVNGDLYMIATKETADKTYAVSDEEVVSFIESFKTN